MTNSPLLVTGGTGTLGGHVLPLLRAAGHDVRVLTRGVRPDADGVHQVTGDLLKDEGIEAAVDGVGTVLHLAGGAKGDDVATGRPVRAARRAGVRYLVSISVVGADRLPLAYFRSKSGAERAVADSGLPYSMLRAAQFHDLALKVAAGTGRLPVVPAPGGLRWQPVDARDVAARLVELALDEPAGLVPDLVGPAVYPLSELVRGYLKARGRSRPALPVRVPGRVGRAYRAGENLTLAGAERGRRTWEAFLAERVG
ncbi:SDR family oxidoreductase [Kitasatospora sp. NPDC091207]|uniref:SDR family oxidoreductase n=1 Tax=Kitasatospora sp. NPDC091207 TaxID=3364083 RepID=UPI0037FC5EB2